MTDTLILTTGSGKFDLLNPRPEDVNIDDMLRNLSRIPRWCGASKISVLKHMILTHDHICLTHKGRGTRLAALTHDLHEYVTGDIPAPLLDKLFVDFGDGPIEVAEIQRQIQVAIEERLRLPSLRVDWAAVRIADIAVRTAESEYLSVSGYVVAPESVQQEWRDRFESLHRWPDEE